MFLSCSSLQARANTLLPLEINDSDTVKLLFDWWHKCSVDLLPFQGHSGSQVFQQLTGRPSVNPERAFQAGATPSVERCPLISLDTCAIFMKQLKHLLHRLRSISFTVFLTTLFFITWTKYCCIANYMLSLFCALLKDKHWFQSAGEVTGVLLLSVYAIVLTRVGMFRRMPHVKCVLKDCWR